MSRAVVGVEACAGCGAEVVYRVPYAADREHICGGCKGKARRARPLAGAAPAAAPSRVCGDCGGSGRMSNGARCFCSAGDRAVAS